jgi:zinc protease
MKFMRKFTSLTFVALALASCASTQTGTKLKAQESQGLNVQKTVLENGLTVLIAPNHKLPIASYYTLFDVGGRYEVKGTTGATHFLEHMMFKGAKKYGPGEFDTLIERNGGSTNAYTTNDATVYYQNMPSSFVPKMIDLEADRLQNLLLDPTSFESERQVIFEERKMRYENSPDGMLYLQMMKHTFEGTPYGQSVIGDVDDLKALTRDQVMSFFKTYYTPENALLAITGDVDPVKTLEEIKEKYGSIKSTKDLKELKRNRDLPKNYEFKAKLGTEYNYYASNPNYKFMYAFPGQKVGTHEAFVLDILSSMLANGGSSYLVQKYVQTEKPLMTEIALSSYNLLHSGVVYFTGELMDGVSVDQFKKTFFPEMKNFCKEGLDEHNLQKAKNQIMAQAYHQMKTTAGMASTILNNERFYGDYNFGIKEMQIYLGVTLAEVQKSCDQYLNNSKGILVSVWNQNPKASTELKQ